MPTQVKQESLEAHSHSQMAICTIVAVAERRRKSRPRFPVYDDEENDSALVDEESLHGIEGAYDGPGGRLRQHAAAEGGCGHLTAIFD